MRRLNTHLQSSSCPHTCFKAMMNKNEYTDDARPGGFMAQLYDSSGLDTFGMAGISAYENCEDNFGSSLLTDNNHTAHQVTMAIGTSPGKHVKRTEIASRDNNLPNLPSTPSSQSSNTKMTKLVSKKGEKTLEVNSKKLREAQQEALVHRDPEFKLMYKMLHLVYSLDELTDSRGTGIRKPRPGDEDKPVLDTERMEILKDYIHYWTKKNVDRAVLDSSLNNAVTERAHYARTQRRKKLQKQNKDA